MTNFDARSRGAWSRVIDSQTADPNPYQQTHTRSLHTEWRPHSKTL